jgi:hypothetical protein
MDLNMGTRDYISNKYIHIILPTEDVDGLCRFICEDGDSSRIRERWMLSSAIPSLIIIDDDDVVYLRL